MIYFIFYASYGILWLIHSPVDTEIEVNFTPLKLKHFPWQSRVCMTSGCLKYFPCMQHTHQHFFSINPLYLSLWKFLSNGVTSFEFDLKDYVVRLSRAYSGIAIRINLCNKIRVLRNKNNFNIRYNMLFAFQYGCQ